MPANFGSLSEANGVEFHGIPSLVHDESCVSVHFCQALVGFSKDFGVLFLLSSVSASFGCLFEALSFG